MVDHKILEIGNFSGGWKWLLKSATLKLQKNVFKRGGCHGSKKKNEHSSG